MPGYLKVEVGRIGVECTSKRGCKMFKTYYVRREDIGEINHEDADNDRRLV